MNATKLKPLIAAGTILLGTAGVPVLAAGDGKGSELWSEAVITTTYTLNRHLNPFDIDVEVSGGVATLRGTVESGVERDLAEELALGVDGIGAVRNEIEVNPEIEPRAGGDDFGDTVRDANITAMVKSQLLWNHNTHGLQIGVDTEDAVVTLSGAVESDAESQLAEQIARNTGEVVDVRNRLLVSSAAVGMGPRIAREAGRATDDIADAWITTKVKTALVYSRDFETGDIDVSTEGGVVHLSGTVDSATHKRAAIDIAKNIRGVHDVKADLKVAPHNS